MGEINVRNPKRYDEHTNTKKITSPGKVVLDALAKVARIETCYNCDSLVNLPDTHFSTISASAYAFCS